MRPAQFITVVFATSLVVTQASAGFADANKEKDNEVEFGMGVGSRQLRLTRGLAEVITQQAPAGTRTKGYSVEFSRRGKELEFVLGFGYDDLSATTGYYLESGGDPLIPGQVDFIEFQNLHWYTLDATILGYLQLHRILAIRYGAGIGVGVVRGRVLRTDAICSSEDIGADCSTDPNGVKQRDPFEIPKAVPVIEALVGLQFRPMRAVAINIDIGIRNIPYLGASAMFYLW